MKRPLMLSVAVFSGVFCELNDNSTTDELTRNKQLTCSYPERKNIYVLLISWMENNNTAVHHQDGQMAYLRSVEDLNLGPQNTNPSSGGEEDLNPRPPDHKFSALNH